MSSPEIQKLVEQIYALSNEQPQELSPWEYARARITREKEGERGYRARAVRIVAEALHLSPHTVARWGTKLENYPPQYGPILLKLSALSDITDIVTKTPDGQRAALRRILPN